MLGRFDARRGEPNSELIDMYAFYIQMSSLRIFSGVKYSCVIHAPIGVIIISNGILEIN